MDKSISKKNRNQGSVCDNEVSTEGQENSIRTNAMAFILSARIDALRELVENEIRNLCGD